MSLQLLIGKLISLVSIHSDVCFRGILVGVDPATSTIHLSNAYAMGTESRRPLAEFVPPVQEPYQYIIFHASNVKDIVVDETVPRWTVHNDPAVLEVVSTNSTPKTYYPAPASGPYPMQRAASSLESVEQALGALSLSTDNPIKSNPSSVTGSLGAKPSLDNFDALSPDIFSSDFISAVAQSLDEFDPGVFYANGDIDFERDFGAWFNQDLDANSKTPENGAKSKGKEIKEEDEFGLWGTEFSSRTFIPLFAPPSPSIPISKQHHRSPRNSLPPPASNPSLRRRDRVSKSGIKLEPSTDAVTSNTSSLKDFIDSMARSTGSGLTPGIHEHEDDIDINFERDFGQWFGQGAINSALDHEFEASDFDVFDSPVAGH